MFARLVDWAKRQVLLLVARDLYNDLCAASPEGHLPDEFAEQSLPLLAAEVKRRK